MVGVQIDAEKVAREVLTDLESALASKDHARIVGVYTDDAVLVGDESTNECWTIEEVKAYLLECAEMEAVIRWTWNTVAATAYSPTAVGFCAQATMTFYVPSQDRVTDPEGFRMSGVVTEVDGRWRISQYHGSRPFGR